MTGKKQASYSSKILRVPKQSHFREAKKGVTNWVCVTIQVVTIWRHYSMMIFICMLKVVQLSPFAKFGSLKFRIYEDNASSKSFFHEWKRAN